MNLTMVPKAWPILSMRFHSPVVSGNLDLSTEALLKDRVKDHVILEIGGQKIGIVSALAVDSVDTSSPGENVVFIDEIEALKADVAAMQGMGVDKIIALTHIGLKKRYGNRRCSAGD